MTWAQQLEALHEQTQLLSSNSMMRDTEAYQTILAMGAEAVPNLLDALDETPAVIPVMMLLEEITGENPVPLTDRGNTDKSIDAWRRWGDEL